VNVEHEFSERDETAQYRLEVLQRNPAERPVFEELSPPVQSYIRENWLGHRDDLPKEERKAHCQLAQSLAVDVFSTEARRDEIIRYGASVAQELLDINKK
jgi:hypothetical protein